MFTIAAVVLSALFRSACLDLNGRGAGRFYRQTLCGFWLGLAGWVAGTVLQAWVPVWQMLVVGVALSLLTAAVRPRFQLYAQAAADFLIVALLGVLSVIPVHPMLVIAAAVVFAAAGFVLDRIRSRVVGSGAGRSIAPTAPTG